MRAAITVGKVSMDGLLPCRTLPARLRTASGAFQVLPQYIPHGARRNEWLSTSAASNEDTKQDDAGPNRVLSLYRKLLRQASRLPEKQNERADALSKIKAGFREARDERSPEKVNELIKRATSQLSYLRIVTPKDRDPEADKATSSKGGKQRWIWHNGELVSADALQKDGSSPFNSASNAGVNPPLDSNDVRRHVANLQRFQFMGSQRVGPPPKGLFG
jgi:Complex 1 protein (LYR family)